ncbi:MAG TPA: preprotein translocase subunit SecG [Stellaceae bacterium]|jgi:preprotein translocase subunit SecG|nr:preprotein translocase subunit SecG [Stellaceae bacterium]
MQTIILVIHLMIAIALVGSVLLQKSEGGALGIGGGGGMSGFMTGRSTANLLTRTTAILAAAFFMTSIVLVVMATHRNEAHSLIEQTAPPGTGPSAPAPAAPGAPGAPQPPASTPGAPQPPSAPGAPQPPAQQ